MRRDNLMKSIVVGLLAIFLVASIIPAAGSIVKQREIDINPSSYPSWSDNFDTYTDGQFLDGTPDDGGWKGWDNDPTFGAFVTSAQSLSSPHSVDIAGDTDLVHEYTGYTFGQWTYTAWQYIPEDFVGESAFILLCKYEDSGERIWSTQLRFNADTGVVHSDNDGNELPLILGEWVEIRVEIDLDNDIQQIYHAGDLLVEKSWKDGVSGGGIANIGAVDLFANFATSIYWDDISLTGDNPIPALCCQGEISWDNIAPGKTVTGEFEVSNCGDDGSLLDWTVDLTPEWGTNWAFTPPSGTGLTPAQGWQTVQVEVTAPTDPEMEFIGKIKVINSNAPAEYCEIDVSLKTPRNRAINRPFVNFLDNHPNLFPIIRQLLGL